MLSLTFRVRDFKYNKFISMLSFNCYVFILRVMEGILIECHKSGPDGISVFTEMCTQSHTDRNFLLLSFTILLPFIYIITLIEL